jgi:hypothetical protein
MFNQKQPEAVKHDQKQSETIRHNQKRADNVLQMLNQSISFFMIHPLIIVCF